MQTSQRVPRYMQYEDLIGGVALIVVALIALWTSRNYPVGSASNMGPGWFPRAVCYLIIALGLVLVLNNLRRPLNVQVRPDTLKFRPLLFIAASYIAFALLLKPLGLLPSVLILILIASFAIPKRSFVELVAVVLALELMTLSMWYIVQLPVPLSIGIN